MFKSPACDRSALHAKRLPAFVWSYRRLLIGLLSVLFAMGSQLAVAEEASLQVSKISAGLGNHYRSGFWTRLRFQLESPVEQQIRVALVTQDGDRTPVRYQVTGEDGTKLPAKTAVGFEVYAKAGPENGRWHLEVTPIHGGMQIIDITPQISRPYAAKREWWITLGPNIGMDSAREILRRPEELAIASTEMEVASELPSQAWQYDGVDCLALTTANNSVWKEGSPQQQLALITWVRRGGKLVLSLSGDSAEQETGKRLLTQLVPELSIKNEPLREKAGLETYTSEALELRETATHPLPIVSRVFPLANDKPDAYLFGKVELAEGGAAADLPLITRHAVGLGQVIVVGLDLSNPNLAQWRGRGRLLAILLASGDAFTTGDKPVRRSSSRLGYDDLSGQLRSALDRFPAVWPINFTAASIFTIVYLLLIGPVDYFVLSRFDLPRHWTWFTFPAIVGLVAGAAWWTSDEAHGEQMFVNQVTLVDIDTTQKVTRGTTWSSFYSPNAAKLNLELVQEQTDWLKATEKDDEVLTWQGLPGSGLGGLASRQVAFEAGTATNSTAPEQATPQLKNLAMHASSSKNLAGAWWGTHDLPDTGKLYLDDYGRLMGDIISPYPFDLSECIIGYQDWLYRVKDWKVGQTIHLSDLTPLSLESRLTLQSISDSKGRITPWQRESTEVPRILQMLMFHETVRGTNYTGLTNRYQSQLDLSQHLRLGRAVIIGKAANPAVELNIRASTADPEDEPLPATVEDQTYYRLVLPVQPKQASSNQP